jgi:Starch-binding associating with outer membrane
MKKIKYISILLAAILFISCKKYLDINKNQNFPTDVEPTLVLSQVLSTTAAASYGGYYGVISQWIGYTSRSLSFAPNTAFESFQITQGQFQGVWAASYHMIYDLNYIEDKSHAGGQPFFEGLAKILKAYWYQSLVDVFNNIPYSEATNPTVIKTPKYDDAKTIYEDLIKKIDEAIVLIKSSGSLSPADTKFDIMFGGNKTRWLKFANTLKLRVLIRQTEITGRAAYIQSEIAKIVTEGSGFLTDDEDALINPGYENSVGKQSPIYGTYLTTAGASADNNFFRAHQYAITFYTSTNDTRIDYVYKKPANGIHLGNWLGDSPNGNAITSNTGVGITKTAEAGFPLMLSFESLFLQSEAVQRGWLTGNAKDLYQRAITASYKYLGVPSAATAASTYYFQAGIVNVNWDASTDKIQAIAMQKWAALNGLNALEAWTEYRRTGYPKITPASKSPVVTTNQVPSRALYPQVEYDVNSENVQGQGSISQFTSKIFWMK